MTGFLKHFLGYYLGLQSYYCNHGNACLRVLEYGKQEEERNKRKTKRVEAFDIILESVFEGFLYVLLGVLFSKVIKKSEILCCFFVGFILHILFEMLRIHEYFCKTRCEQTTM